MPRKTTTTARKTASARKAAPTKQNPSKAQSAKGAKKAPVFEARIGDQKSLDAAKVAGESARKAIAERNTAIVSAVKGGTSARQVAIAVGLTHPAVLKIVKGA